MYRTHTNGELRTSDIDNEVTLSGWVQNVRNKGFLVWVDLRDRYGITQLIFDGERSSKELIDKASHLGREFVIQVTGKVIERQSKNPNMPTGDIEILVSELNILNKSKTPPFTIEDKTDGGEELRLKYRYLDIRRNPIREKLIFRHKVAMAVRNYLSKEEFIEVETPYLIKSTPEGARDFVVPSRMNKGQFYALPQSPQTFKQLLMVGGMDKYFQIVRCFRDEDLRADRQPEFTQIDCEMAFVTQEDVLQTFEGLLVHLLAELKDVKIDGAIPRMTYDDAMKKYGNDKPDIRFGMEFGELNEVAQHKEFNVFNEAELVVGIAIPGANSYSRREIDDLIKWVRRPQVGAKGMVYARCDEDGTFRSSVDKFYDQEDLAKWAEVTGAKPGDLICVLSGDKNEVRGQLSALRMEMAERLGLRNPEEFAPLWVIDFPLLEWDEDSQRYHAMHHPFTAPKEGQLEMLDTDPAGVKANAYDLVLNGNEIGGGSIRIHDRTMQDTMFKHLGFSKEEAQKQFGFLLEAFEYGAPPHAGIAFGMDRLTAILGGQETIREYIAFPKNNMGRDLMIDAPATIDQAQLEELSLKVEIKEK